MRCYRYSPREESRLKIRLSTKAAGWQDHRKIGKGLKNPFGKQAGPQEGFGHYKRKKMNMVERERFDYNQDH